MKLSCKLPAVLEFPDYHDADFLEDYLSEIVPSIKMKEVGFNGQYLFIFYTGRISDPANAKLLRQTKEEIQELDREFDFYTP